MSTEQKLIGDMKAALHGVDTFLAQILNGSEHLSDPARNKGMSLRALLKKVLEAASGYGKPALLSPSSSAVDFHNKPAPDLPAKPKDALPPPLETMEVEIEQENYEAMDPVDRPRIDTSGSIYAPMASVVPMSDGDVEPITEDTYEAMAPSPGHSGSGQVKHQVEEVTEDLYLPMDGAGAMDGPPPPGKKPPMGLPPKPQPPQQQQQQPPPPLTSNMSNTTISQISVTDSADGFEGEEYTDMSVPGRPEVDDFYEAPEQVMPTPPAAGGSHDSNKARAQTLPAAGSLDGADDEDQYAYQIPVNAQKMSADTLNNASRKGYLDKLGGHGGKKWQKRYVVLADGAMYYFEGEKDKRPRNVVPISGYRVEEDPEHSKGKKYAFKVTPLSADKAKSSMKSVAKGKGGKMYRFRANSIEEREGWIGALRVALVRSNRRSATFLDAPVDEKSASGSGSVTSNSSRQDHIPEDLYEDPSAPAPARTPPKPVTSPVSPAQEDYLDPTEVTESPLHQQAAPDTYLPPVEVTKPRASSTFGIGKEVDVNNLGGENLNNPYSSRKDANPYASRQTMRLPTPPPGENPQNRKKMQALPKPPDSNPYASRNQMQLPPIPDKPVSAPIAPIAPRGPLGGARPQSTSSGGADPMNVNTAAIYVQLPDAKFKFEQVFVALWDYQPSASDELGFRRGELVYIEDILSDVDWWVGRKKSVYDEDAFTGDRGLLVSAYVMPAYEKLI